MEHHAFLANSYFNSCPCVQIRDMSGEEPFKNYLEVRKRKHHFIFTIENCVSTPPEVLFARAIDILKGKCSRLESML